MLSIKNHLTQISTPPRQPIYPQKPKKKQTHNPPLHSHPHSQTRTQNASGSDIRQAAHLRMHKQWQKNEKMIWETVWRLTARTGLQYLPYSLTRSACTKARKCPGTDQKKSLLTIPPHQAPKNAQFLSQGNPQDIEKIKMPWVLTR